MANAKSIVGGWLYVWIQKGFHGEKAGLQLWLPEKNSLAIISVSMITARSAVSTLMWPRLEANFRKVMSYLRTLDCWGDMKWTIPDSVVLAVHLGKPVCLTLSV